MTHDERTCEDEVVEETPEGAMMRRAFELFRASGVDGPSALAHLVGRVWSNLQSANLQNTIALGGAESGLPRGSRSEAILDLTDLYHRMGDSASRVGLILAAFASCFHEQYVQLMESQELEPGEVQAAAHAVKGLLMEVGAKQPAVLAAEMEQMCRAGDVAEARKLIPVLGDQIIVTARLVKRIVSVLHVDSEPLQVAEGA
jgi:HPt (histidine-containing phosphotransfer) domain-containing protein